MILKSRKVDTFEWDAEDRIRGKKMMIRSLTEYRFLPYRCFVFFDVLESVVSQFGGKVSGGIEKWAKKRSTDESDFSIRSVRDERS